MSADVKVGDKIYTQNHLTDSYTIYTVKRITKIYLFAVRDGDANEMEHKILKRHVNGYQYGLLTPDVNEDILRHKKQNIFYNYLELLKNNFRRIAEEDMDEIMKIARNYKVKKDER